MGVLAFVILVAVFACEGDSGTVWALLIGGAVIVVCTARSVWKRDVKAWSNREEYWARGGPDGRK